MIGADVMHRASGAEGRPSSFTAVSSIDLMASKHFALSPIQAGSQEIINNLEEMWGVRRFHSNDSSWLSFTNHSVIYCRRPWEIYRGTRL